MPNTSRPQDDDGGLDLAADHANVLVTRTFSKAYGLAGERVGWATGAPELVEVLNRIRGPFNLNNGAQAVAAAAVGDQDFVVRSREHNLSERARFVAAVEALGNHGLRALPSEANFVLVLFEGALSAGAAHDGLAARGYATRWLPGQGLAQGLRITIGTERPDGRHRGDFARAGGGRPVSLAATPFERVAIIGLGLIGGSIGLAVRDHLPGVTTTGYDADPAVRKRAQERELADTIYESASEAVHRADLVILCVPVGAMGEIAREIAPALSKGAVISDVGSSKQTVAKALREVFPDGQVIPAHPVAGHRA